MSVVTCPKCGDTVAMRVNRNGFLQRQVLSWMGLYPWKCGSCGIVFLFRRRGQRPRSVRSDPQGPSPGQSAEI